MLVLKEKGLKLEYKYSIKCKNTARCPEQYVAGDENNELYLVVFAKTNTQIFYALRAVEMQEQFRNTIVSTMKTNIPVYSGFLSDGFYVIYHFFNSFKETFNELPQKLILDLYENNATEVEVDNNIVRKIEEDFLTAFPSKYHPDIRNLDAFHNFHSELKKFDKLKICFQHGDFTPNNILEVDGENLFLMDFEFSLNFQPIGFDLFDYHYATDKKYDFVPYLEINSIKEELQNQANKLIDASSMPKVIQPEKIPDINIYHHWSDDLIYNRPDLFEQNSYTLYISSEEDNFVVHYYIVGVKAILCVWLKSLPSQVVEFAVNYILVNHKTVLKIEMNYSSTNCRNALSLDNNWVVFLPERPEEIFNRLGKKSKYNFKREMKILENLCGVLSINHYKKVDIPQNVFDVYFVWKKLSHSVDYNMQGREYCEKYHITDGMTLCAGGRIVAVLFYCVQNRTVYLENISYDVEYSKCSPGIILYEKFLERMTEENMDTVFLGNGNQLYKTRFGSIEYMVYSGSIYRNNFFKYLNNIKKLGKK